MFSGKTYFGKYPQSSELPEDIKWDVIAKNGCMSLLVSENILDCCDYEGLEAWYSSFLEAAFSEEEKKQMKRPCEFFNVVSKEMCFSLSKNMAMDNSYGFDEDEKHFSNTRMKKTTKYSEIQGCYSSESVHFNGNGYWWLSSGNSEKENDYAYRVNYDGAIAYYDKCAAYCGVVPVICVKDCKIICDNAEIVEEMENFEDIRVAIWDLDDTLWKGGITEGPIELKPQIYDYLRKSTCQGIINCINSKNDEPIVKDMLEKLNIADYFVFNYIGYSSKGFSVRKQIEQMTINERHVLFIDDNIYNLVEVKSQVPNIGILDAKNMMKYINWILTRNTETDKSQQLEYYRNKERLFLDRINARDDLEFLNGAGITLNIKTVTENVIDRLVELAHKSNQLNYTKWRFNKDELIGLLSDKSVISAYIEESDKYGTNGIIGMFSMKDGELLNFFFSCRIMNLGIEDYVYSILGHPQITVVEPVAHPLEMGKIDYNIKVESDLKKFASRCIYE